MSSTAKRKISSKTLKDKYEALKKIERGIPKKDVAAQYKVPRNTLSTWVKNKEKIVKAFEGGNNPSTQKLKSSGHENLDQATYKWFVKMREEGLPISGPVIKEKAAKYAVELGIDDFKASNGWFDRWKGRHEIVFKTVSGEAQSCTKEMTASWEESTLPTILSNYELRDIYNADEFGLFYKALPDKSLHLKSENCVGGKHSKVRLTGLAAGNAVGEKLPMLVIGKSKKPRCFSGVRNLPCLYKSQKKSWMDSALFEEWVRGQDRKFECEGRKIALIVDNCPAHPAISNLKAINLVFLPPNTTCKTQPMDQGVIRSTKAFYRGTIVRRYIDAVEKGKPPPNITILDAMTILAGAWNRVSAETVRNCFRKAGIGSEAQQSAIHDDDNPFRMLTEEMESLRENYPELVPECVTSDAVIDTDQNLLTSDMGSLTDEDILAEFKTDDVEQEDSEDELEVLEVQENCPKRPTTSEVRQAIDTLATYSLFVEEGAEEIRRVANDLTVLTDRIKRKRQQQQTIKSFLSAESETMETEMQMA